MPRTTFACTDDSGRPPCHEHSGKSQQYQHQRHRATPVLPAGPHQVGRTRVIVAFDMFGTLADTSSVEAELTALCGDRAGGVAATWRTRQLEYMFRVTAMGQFPSFADLT